MNRAHLYILAGLLAAIGGGFFFYKLFVFGFPLQPEERTDVWRVEVQIQFEADGGSAKVALFLPRRTGELNVVDQNFVSSGYGVTTEPQLGRGLLGVFSIREASGTQTLYYRAVLQSSRVRDEKGRDPAPNLPPLELEEAERVAAETVIRDARQQSSDARTLAPLIIKRLREARPGSEASFLLGPHPSDHQLMAVAVKLLRVANVPARFVNGISLAPERRDAHVVQWLEFYDNGRWHDIHSITAAPDARSTYLPWWRGEEPLVQLTGGRQLQYKIATSRSYELATRTALNQQRDLEKKLVEFSLFGLPLQAQTLFRTLMVIPVGILLLVILRNIVGIKTFGTFMPVLIALAFRQTGPLWGVLFLCIVIGLGLAVRFYLDRLKLLLVPRLASVVILVVLIIAVLSVLSYKLGLDRGLSLGLFPIVIMTMTIERMTQVWEERGPGEAFQQGFGSIAVGMLCYFVMNLPIVEHLCFVFPELLLVVLAAMLLLGRYSGYRITELYRFRVLAQK